MAITTRRYNSLRWSAKAFLLIAIPIALLILPADHFNEGQSLCLSVLLFDQECFGCGMTRGVMNFIHFNWQTAWEFHKMSVIVAPLLGLYWFKLTAEHLTGKRVLKMLK